MAVISTHAPAGGATRHGGQSNRVGLHFYSRPCGRGDYEVLLQISGCIFFAG